MAEKRAGIWSEMYNLGPEINTPGNEVFPFLHESGILFFSSDGHKGMGKLDLYFIDISPRIWGPLTSLGEPFNSRFDDFGLIVDPAGRSGFFTSDRPGGLGKDDLYGFRSPQGINGLFQPSRKRISIRINDAREMQPIEGASVYLFERGEDGLIANNSAYEVQIIPTSGSAGREASLQFLQKPVENFESPTALSQKDGEAIFQVSQGKDYIVVIHAPGYQSRELLLFAKNPGAVKPMEVNLHPQNCRKIKLAIRSAAQQIGLSGVKVRLRIQNESMEEVSYTTIEGTVEPCIAQKTNYTLFLEKEGFQPLQVSLDSTQLEISTVLNFSMTPLSASVSGTPISENTVVLLPQSNRDFGKTPTDPGEDRNLSGLLRILEVFPELHIELGVHTDSRGEASFNLQLSQLRAETSKAFLVERGIDSSRIRAVGYGETRLRNGCEDGVPCSEAEHKQNRRTEIRMIHSREPSGN
jgi:outer membrane protein OmpA-like peptidoglycan-associated protein